MKKQNQEEKEFVKEYKKKNYPAPNLTADNLIFCTEYEKPEILLIRRGKHPFQGKWALPGGFVNPNEDAAQAALRELEEETGLNGLQVEAVGFYSYPGRDPRGWIVSEVYYSIQDKKPAAKAEDDARDATWFVIEENHQGQKLQLSLTSGEEVIRIEAEVSLAPVSGQTIAVHAVSDELAFDHAQIIADGWLKFRQTNH